MANTTKMLAPGTAGAYSVADGTTFQPGADGTVDAPAGYVAQLVTLGFSVVGDDPIDTTANRPTVATPGMPWFDSTLGKPIWRNAANTLWVDATGATV